MLDVETLFCIFPVLLFGTWTEKKPCAVHLLLYLVLVQHFVLLFQTIVITYLLLVESKYGCHVIVLLHNFLV